MANECIPYWDEADALTCYCKGAATGKRFVAIAGARTNGLPTIGVAGGGTSGLTTRVVGVAAQDAVVTGTVTVLTDGIVPVTAGGAISAGDPITFDSTGKAVKATGSSGNTVLCHGYAVDDATSNNDCPVKLAPNTAFLVP